MFDDNKVEYHGRTLSNIFTQERARARCSPRWCASSGSPPPATTPAQIEKLVRASTSHKIRVTEEGSKADAGVGDLILAVGLFIILYMTIMIYGQMVMHGVLEEKANRVVEVIASTVKPTQLMAGKLVGICAVGAHPDRRLAGLGGGAHRAGWWSAGLALPEGVHLPTLSPAVVVHFVALFLLGFVLYASFYALIGAAFNNPQEAQQLASIGVFFVVVAVDGVHAGAQRPRLDDGRGVLADPAVHADDHDAAHRRQDAAALAARARLRAHLRSPTCRWSGSARASTASAS